MNEKILNRLLKIRSARPAGLDMWKVSGLIISRYGYMDQEFHLFGDFNSAFNYLHGKLK